MVVKTLPLTRLSMSGLTVALLLASCTAGLDKKQGRDIVIPDLTGYSRANAIALLDNLDVGIRVERVDAATLYSGPDSPETIPGGPLATDAVLRQSPPPNTTVEGGSVITLFVPAPRPLRPGERPIRLLTHCGLSYPLTFGGQRWLPVDRNLRATINQPEGFASHGYHDKGTIRRASATTLIYTSSTGVEVRYRPTERRPGECE